MMMAKGNGEGRRRRTTQEPAGAGKIHSAMGEEQRGGASELRLFRKMEWTKSVSNQLYLPCPSRASGLIGVLDGADQRRRTTRKQRRLETAMEGDGDGNGRRRRRWKATGDGRRGRRRTTGGGRRATTKTTMATDERKQRRSGRAKAKMVGRCLVVCSRNGRGVEGQRRRWSVAVWSVACSRNGRGAARSEARASSEGVRIPNFKNSNSRSVILILDIVFEVAKNVNPRESPCPRVQISNFCHGVSR